MIPEFDENGYLPAGVHPATLAEIEVRFGRESELRRVQFESLRWMVDLAVKAGVLRIIINGSYVTDVYEPNDVDCVLLIDENYPLDELAADELEAGLPFMSFELAFADAFDGIVDSIFATDRNLISKGMIEVMR